MSTAAPQYGHGLVGVAIEVSPVLSPRTVTRASQRKQRTDTVLGHVDHPGALGISVRDGRNFRNYLLRPCESCGSCVRPLSSTARVGYPCRRGQTASRTRCASRCSGRSPDRKRERARIRGREHCGRRTRERYEGAVAIAEVSPAAYVLLSRRPLQRLPRAPRRCAESARMSVAVHRGC